MRRLCSCLPCGREAPQWKEELKKCRGTGSEMLDVMFKDEESLPEASTFA